MITHCLPGSAFGPWVQSVFEQVMGPGSIPGVALERNIEVCECLILDKKCVLGYVVE